MLFTADAAVARCITLPELYESLSFVFNPTSTEFDCRPDAIVVRVPSHCKIIIIITIAMTMFIVLSS